MKLINQRSLAIEGRSLEVSIHFPSFFLSIDMILKKKKIQTTPLTYYLLEYNINNNQVLSH